jgi:hypothetical protein
METDSPIIIEGNFVPAGIKNVDESHVIRTLIEKYNYQSLTFKFKGDTKVLHQRYIERDKLPERGGVNAFYKGCSYSDFDVICRNLDSFHINENFIIIDTTDIGLVDFNFYTEKAYLFMRNIPK